MKTETLFSHKTDDWEMPDDLYEMLNMEFGFTLDACADDQNHKCEEYFTQEQDGLQRDWGGTAYGAIHRIAKSLSGQRNATRNGRKEK